MTLSLATALQRGVIARLFMSLKIVNNFVDASNPFHARQEVIDFGFEYWAAEPLSDHFPLPLLQSPDEIRFCRAWSVRDPGAPRRQSHRK
jgi:hypothetical protein